MIYKIIIHQLIPFKLILFVISSPIKVLDKGILPLETNSVAIQFYLDLENDDKSEFCYVSAKSDKCCLFDSEEADCDSMNLIGKYDGALKPKDRKTYLFFYTTMFQVNRKGYCNFALVYRCGFAGSNSEEIRVPFDTTINKKQTQYLLRNFKNKQTHKCKSIDEDPLNGCMPVDCDFKYAGAKPFFSKEKGRCIEAVKCVLNPYKKLPDLVYDPASNTCKALGYSLSVNDIFAISSGLGTTIASRNSDQNVIKDVKLVVYKANGSSISQNVLFLKDLMLGKLNPAKGYAVDVKESSNEAFVFIFTTIFGISSLIVLFVCFTNAFLIIRKEWYSEYNRGGHRKGNTKLASSNGYAEFGGRKDGASKEVTNRLLKEVIVSELPLELRESVVDICERIGKEVRWKKRYRMIDDGSDINLKPLVTSDTYTTSDLDENERALILK